MAFQMFVDATGIPYSDYGNYQGKIEIGRQRSILSVAERGLWYWNEFFVPENSAPVLLSYDWEKHPANRDANPSDSGAARSMLLNCAEWMLDSITQDDGFSAWVYPYPFSYDTKAGWRSAHAQSVGLQLLTRAADLSERPEFLEPMESLLAAFSVNVANGGLATATEGGNTWFEKIADSGNRQPKVLNGLLFAIIGLLDVSERTGTLEAKRLADVGMSAALELMPKFDLGDWSAYDAHGRRSSPHYHAIHIRQLSILARAYPHAALVSYLAKFTRYREMNVAKTANQKSAVQARNQAKTTGW